MADISGLLDTLFLSKQNPELINLLGLTEEQKAALATQQNLGTGIGVIKGVAENYNQGILPSILGGYLGGSAGRQAPVANIIQQKKTAVDISKGLQELEKLGYDTRKLKREETGVQRQIIDAANKGASPEDINYLLINPTEAVKGNIGRSPLYNKDLNLFASSYKNPNINTWTGEDFRNFQTWTGLASAADSAKEDINRAKLAYETGTVIKAPLTREQFLNSINAGTSPQGQPTGTPTGAPQATPQAKPSTGFKQPEKEIKQGLPLVESSAIAPKNREQLILEQPKATAATEYALGSTRRIRNTINRILDNPNFSAAFGKDGVLLSYIPNTEAASAAAELDTLKNQLFVEGITDMRNASQTGAAVGNVTEKEGSRFENLKGSLQQKKKFKDIVSELERIDKEMDLAEKRISNAYGRTYRQADFIVDPLYTRGSYKPATSPRDVPLNSPSGAKGNWGIREIK
jgi:hypothetical protein